PFEVPDQRHALDIVVGGLDMKNPVGAGQRQPKARAALGIVDDVATGAGPQDETAAGNQVNVVIAQAEVVEALGTQGIEPPGSATPVDRPREGRLRRTLVQNRYHATFPRFPDKRTKLEQNRADVKLCP